LLIIIFVIKIHQKYLLFGCILFLRRRIINNTATIADIITAINMPTIGPTVDDEILPEGGSVTG
jgi:hypothetical protein